VGHGIFCNAIANGSLQSILMDKAPIYDELRKLENDRAEGERRLAKQEALIIELKRENRDTAKAEAELERMRHDQRRYDQDRHGSYRCCSPDADH
jgi:hypothetical protein